MKNVLFIAKKSKKAESLIVHWPRDKWNFSLYTYRRDEWFPGMADLLADRWHSLYTGMPFEKLDQQAAMVAGKVKKKKNSLDRFFLKIQKYLSLRVIRVFKKDLWAWALPADRQLPALLETVKPDIVISMYGPLAANVIARRIAVRYDIPWIAYFRDHCTTYNELFRIPFIWHVQALFDRWVHGPLNAVIGVSPQFTAILAKFYRIPAANALTITGCFSDDYLPEAIREECLARRHQPPAGVPATGADTIRISYIGKLYRHQVDAMIIFLQAVDRLAVAGVRCELVIRLSNAASFLSDSVKLLLQRLEKNGIILDFKPQRIVYSEALTLLNSSDINLIVEGMSPPHSTAGTATGKIFDLMMIGRPSLAVCSSLLPIGDYLRETGIGTHCETPAEIGDFINDVAQFKKQGRKPQWYAPDAREINKYSFASMAARISVVADEMIAARKGSFPV